MRLGPVHCQAWPNSQRQVKWNTQGFCWPLTNLNLLFNYFHPGTSVLLHPGSSSHWCLPSSSFVLTLVKLNHSCIKQALLPKSVVCSLIPIPFTLPFQMWHSRHAYPFHCAFWNSWSKINRLLFIWNLFLSYCFPFSNTCWGWSPFYCCFFPTSHINGYTFTYTPILWGIVWNSHNPLPFPNSPSTTIIQQLSSFEVRAIHLSLSWHILLFSS